MEAEMNFSLIHPSRGRHLMAMKNRDNWLAKADHPELIEHIFSIDESDQFKAGYSVRPDRPQDKLVLAHNDCVVMATNMGAKKAKAEILIYLSDDFDCPIGWDTALLAIKGSYDGHFRPFAIEVSDAYQINRNLLTIPIISRAMYKWEGYFFHPSFKSMFCDNWIYERAKREYELIDAYHLTFEHKHYSRGFYKRDTTNQMSESNWNQGKITFNHLAAHYKYNVCY